MRGAIVRACRFGRRVRSARTPGPTAWDGPDDGSGAVCSPDCPGYLSLLDGTTYVRPYDNRIPPDRGANLARHRHSRGHLDKPRLDIRPPLAEWCGRSSGNRCSPDCGHYRDTLAGRSYVTIVDEYGHHGCHHGHICPGQPPEGQP